MNTLFRAGLLGICAVLTGCGGNHTVTFPDTTSKVPASASAFLRAGDRITVQLTGTPDNGYIIEKQIPSSGQITVPYLNIPFMAAGVNPGDLGEEITQAYKSKNIYRNPIVTILPEAQYISVGGEVRNPSSVTYRPDLTLVSLINSCGGFTEFANKRSVRIIRPGKIIYVNYNEAVEDPGKDQPVYPGDQIFVPRTIL